MIGSWNKKESPLLGMQGSGGGLGYLAGRVSTAAFLEYTTTSSVSSFTLLSIGTVDYEVDWGDGTVQSYTTNNPTHTYSSAGEYTIKITPAEGSTYRPYFNDLVSDTSIASVSGSGGSQLGTTLQSAWRGASNMTSFDGNIDTSGVTNFTRTWRNCSGLTSFPLIDTSSGTDLGFAWSQCSGLTGAFPALDFSSATDVGQAWNGCSNLVEFPSVDFSSVTDSFRRTWYFCTSLTTFPANQFDNINVTSSTGFQDAFRSCALTAQSIENILVSLDTWGASNIELGIHSGNNASKTTWSTAANTAYTNLINKGWTISYNP